MKRAGKRYLALFLVLAVCLSIFPAELFAAREGNNVVINQVYGGGGNSGATYKNDFIELYNPTNSDIVLDGWSVQYASKTGAFSVSNLTVLTGIIQAGGYYLIQEAKGNGGTADLPTPDKTGNIAMSGTDFKVALVQATTAITGINDPNVVDFVGAGTANAYEGSATAPAPSNTLAIIRTTDGSDTDDNSTDFITAAPNPRNSESGGNPIETRVAAPTASIPEGPVVSGTRVALASTTSGAAIYYTVDGSTPTATTGSGISVRYSIPIAINTNVSITAIAVDERGVLEDSDVVSFTYTIKEASNVDDPIPDNSFPSDSKIAGNNMYEPNREITRSELACMLYKYAMTAGIDTGEPAAAGSFADGRTVSVWSADAMGWAIGAGLINADDNNRINPNAKISRAEVAGILRHLVELGMK